MKIAKYILSALLILRGFDFIIKSVYLTGLFILLLGVILMPPISDILKQKIISWKNKNIRYSVYFLFLHFAGLSISEKESKYYHNKQSILVNYIKNDTSDNSIQNIRELGEIGELFNNGNYSTIYPNDGYIIEQYDSINKVFNLTFNPKFKLGKKEERGYLKNDIINGKLENYIVQFVINFKDSIISKNTIITYSKIGKKVFFNNDVPKTATFINEVAVMRRREQIAKEEQIANELRKFNEEMGQLDFWKKYDPIVKKRIYKYIVNKNCAELQKEFNLASNMMKRKQKSELSADKELEFIDFLDNRMREIGCYK